ncbi:MAG: hypothetical protein LBL41_03990 [Bifidobacteriaceae bacterium]|jgi:hypothetical protein|nr:hypothetical protein [Bifidobacteriaceae bacterium]
MIVYILDLYFNYTPNCIYAFCTSNGAKKFIVHARRECGKLNVVNIKSFVKVEVEYVRTLKMGDDEAQKGCN